MRQRNYTDLTEDAASPARRSAARSCRFRAVPYCPKADIVDLCASTRLFRDSL